MPNIEDMSLWQRVERLERIIDRLMPLVKNYVEVELQLAELDLAETAKSKPNS